MFMLPNDDKRKLWWKLNKKNENILLQPYFQQFELFRKKKNKIKFHNTSCVRGRLLGAERKGKDSAKYHKSKKNPL